MSFIVWCSCYPVFAAVLPPGSLPLMKDCVGQITTLVIFTAIILQCDSDIMANSNSTLDGTP